MYIYRRPKNLRNLLTKATLKAPLTVHEGSSRCRRPRCKTCQLINTDTTFSSAATGFFFRVRATATYKSRKIIYLIECKACGIQYVGETGNALHIPMNGHRSDIKRNHPDRLVAAHFNTVGHSIGDLTVRVIEQLRRNSGADPG